MCFRNDRCRHNSEMEPQQGRTASPLRRRRLRPHGLRKTTLSNGWAECREKIGIEPKESCFLLTFPLIGLFRLRLPAQPVDATPSNQLIRQYFPWRTDLFGCTRSKPSQGSVPTDLTSRAILALVFSARWVRAECCVGPLRLPRVNQALGQNAWLRNEVIAFSAR